MAKFKVGDRVRDHAPGKYTGLEGTVVEVQDDYIGVRFDSYEYLIADDCHTREASHLELAPLEKVRFKAKVFHVLDDGSKVEVVQSEDPVEDDVKSPAHYNSGKIEVWDFIYDQGLGYAAGNAVKYVTRAGKKAGNSKVKDLQKAIAFLEREIRFEETGE